MITMIMELVRKESYTIITGYNQGCELEAFLIEFEFEFTKNLQVRVRVRVL